MLENMFYVSMYRHHQRRWHSLKKALWHSANTLLLFYVCLQCRSSAERKIYFYCFAYHIYIHTTLQLTWVKAFFQELYFFLILCSFLSTLRQYWCYLKLMFIREEVQKRKSSQIPGGGWAGLMNQRNIRFEQSKSLFYIQYTIS